MASEPSYLLIRHAAFVKAFKAMFKIIASEPEIVE